MTDPIRQEVLKALAELSELAPDFRFGQMVANLSYMAVAPTVEAVWDMEDHELLAAIRQRIEDLSRLKTPVA